MTHFARFISALAGLVLLASIVWAGFVMGSNLLSEGARILEMPWGVVTLIDLYAGFIIFAAIVLVVEQNKLLAVAIALPVFVLGNVVMAAWAVWRLPRLAAMAKAAVR